MDLSNLPLQTAEFTQIWPFLKVGVHNLMDSPEKISETEYMNLSVTVYNLVMRSRTCALGKKHSKISWAFLNVLCVELQKELKDIFFEDVQLALRVTSQHFKLLS